MSCEKLNDLLAQTRQRMIETGQEETMQQLFMEQLQNAELDEARWGHLLLELLKISPELSTNSRASLRSATAEQLNDT